MSNSRIRVMQISSEYPPYVVSGLGTHVHQLVQGLNNDYTEVFVFAFNPDSSSVVSNKNVTVCSISLPEEVEGLREKLDLRKINSLNDQIVQFSGDFFSKCPPPDLIHCHDWYAFSAAKKLRHIFKSPIVTTMHFLEEWTRWSGGNPRSECIEVQSQMCNMSDAIITVSQFMKREVERIGNLDPGLVHVVYNGVDTSQIAASGANGRDIEAIKREYASNGEKIVLFAGRIDFLKGVSALLISAARVLELISDTIYLIAGECLPGEYTDMVFSLFQNLPRLKERVRFLGRLPRNRLFQLYHAASVVVVPSIYESFGYVAAEAMAAGTPVIASNTGGLSELIEHGKNGFLVPLNRDNSGYHSVDARKLADAQVELLQDDALRLRLGLAGQQLVNSKFTLQNMVNATTCIYADVLEASKGNLDI
jgi:alpha-maltose-1-phosphate synthase